MTILLTLATLALLLYAMHVWLTTNDY